MAPSFSFLDWAGKGSKGSDSRRSTGDPADTEVSDSKQPGCAKQPPTHAGPKEGVERAEDYSGIGAVDARKPAISDERIDFALVQLDGEQAQPVPPSLAAFGRWPVRRPSDSLRQS